MSTLQEQNRESDAGAPGQPAADPQDRFYCSNLFLGHASENISAAGQGVSSLHSLVREAFDNEEFRTGTLQAILMREDLPNARSESVPLFRLMDWAQRRLPVTEKTRRSLGGARNRSQLLELLLSDAQLLALSPELAAAGIGDILRERLEKESWCKVQRAVVGAVDAASGFEVRGWAMDLCDKSTPVCLEFYADNLFVGSAACDRFRPDIVDAIGGDGKCGFRFRISAAHTASFGRGRNLIAIDSISREPIGAGITVYADAAQSWDFISAIRNEVTQLRKTLDRIEGRLPEICRTASIPVEAYDEYWHRFYQPTPDWLSAERIQARSLAYQPLISVVLPTWKSNSALLRKAINSVCGQTYEKWELIITDDASLSDELKFLKNNYADEARIRWMEATSRSGIAANTNRGIDAAQGEYVAFLDHDDELAPDALYQVCLTLQQRRYGLLYSDEDRIEENEVGRCIHHTPFFKPDFDPDLLLALNYICHLVVVRRDVVSAAGGLRSGVEGAQDHDFLLRAVASLRHDDIAHVPRMLYHWRVTPGSVSRDPQAADDIQNRIVAVVKDQVQRLGLHATVESHSDPVGSARQFAARIRWHLPVVAPSVSVIIATRDRLDLLGPCLGSVLDSLRAYPGTCEIVLIDNDSSEPATSAYFESLSDVPQLRLLRFQGAFNWAAINNFGAREARGEILIFLNNDTVVITKDWCGELVANAIRPDVGAVGARLLYADGTIQHAGVVLGVEGVAGHECVGDSPADGGLFGRSQLLRSTAAVTGACLTTRRTLFHELSGFDDLNLRVAFNDIDYCMKVREAGYRVVYNPFAVLYHLESKSRGREVSEIQQERHRQEAAFFRSRWGHSEMLDPYYNPHFERFARPFDRLRPPPRCAGNLVKAVLPQRE